MVRCTLFLSFQLHTFVRNLRNAPGLRPDSRVYVDLFKDKGLGLRATQVAGTVAVRRGECILKVQANEWLPFSGAEAWKVVKRDYPALHSTIVRRSTVSSGRHSAVSGPLTNSSPATTTTTTSTTTTTTAATSPAQINTNFAEALCMGVLLCSKRHFRESPYVDFLFETFGSDSDTAIASDRSKSRSSHSCSYSSSSSSSSGSNSNSSGAFVYRHQFAHPLLLPQRMLSVLKHSSHYEYIVQRCNLYASIAADLFPPSVAPAEDREAFLFAMSLILSRGISGSDRHGHPLPLSLVPYIDIANHCSATALPETSAADVIDSTSTVRGPNAEVHFDATTGAYSLRALRDVLKDEEVCISYGSERNNSSFLALYGFYDHSASTNDVLVVDVLQDHASAITRPAPHHDPRNLVAFNHAGTESMITQCKVPVAALQYLKGVLGDIYGNNLTSRRSTSVEVLAPEFVSSFRVVMRAPMMALFQLAAASVNNDDNYCHNDDVNGDATKPPSRSDWFDSDGMPTSYLEGVVVGSALWRAVALKLDELQRSETEACAMLSNSGVESATRSALVNSFGDASSSNSNSSSNSSSKSGSSAAMFGRGIDSSYDGWLRVCIAALRSEQTFCSDLLDCCDAYVRIVAGLPLPRKSNDE